MPRFWQQSISGKLLLISKSRTLIEMVIIYLFNIIPDCAATNSQRIGTKDECLHRQSDVADVNALGHPSSCCGEDEEEEEGNLTELRRSGPGSVQKVPTRGIRESRKFGDTMTQ